MKKIIVFVLAAIFALFAVSCNRDEQSSENSNHIVIIDTSEELTPLAENGVSRYSVVIAEDASECMEYAAQELVSFVYSSTSASLPVIRDSEATFDENNNYISIGKTSLLSEAAFEVDYSAMNVDGFFIKSVGNMFFIDGNLERAALYGVYDFIERFLGVRFLTSTATHIPTHSAVQLYRTDILEIPDFPVRLYLNVDTFHNVGTQEFAARTRQDTSYLLYTDEKYGEPTTMYARGLRDHNMRYFVPEEIYNDPVNHPDTYHPEFYQTHETYHTTLCLTNGITDEGTLDTSMELSVAKIVAEEMKKDILAHPECTYFIFEQEDGQVYCLCDRCTKAAEKYMRSGVLMRFCNVVNREIQSWLEEENIDREVNIVTFAYSYTIDPPVDTTKNAPIDDTVIADDNVIIRTAFAYNMLYPYSSDKQDLYLQNTIKYWKMCANTFFYWVHDKDFYDYLSYCPSFKHIKKNVLDMKDYGVEYVMIQGSQNAPGDWQSYLRSYVYRNLLWDSSKDAEALTDEFITLYWGETAAPYVKQFMNAYEYNYDFAAKQNPDLYIYTLAMDYVDPTKGAISLNFLNSMIDIIEQAEAAVNAEPGYSYNERTEYLRRLAECKATPYGTLYRNYTKFRPTASADEEHEFLREFYELIDFAGITMQQETISFAQLRERDGF